MKKLILMAAALVLGMGVMTAQDMGKATETYNAGAEALQLGDNAGAVAKFTEALTLAEACGDEGADIVSKCKEYIPQIQLSIFKDLFNEKNFAAALSQLDVVAAAAEKYGNADIAAEVVSFRPQVWMQEGNNAIKAKDFATAATKFGLVAEADPENGMALLRLGQSLASLKKTEEAIDAFKKAAEKGQEETAMKQISNIFVKQASAALKAKNYKAAIESALESNKYLENATAFKVAGTAAQLLKDNKAAIEYLKKYLELSPNAKDANQMFYTIAALAQTQGDKATAKSYYEKILTDPKFGETAKQMLEALK